MFSNILVAVDGSEASQKAVDWVKQSYSELTHTKFTFIYVYQPYMPVAGPGIYPAAMIYQPVEIKDEDTPSYQAWNEFSDKERVFFKNMEGNPSDVICKEAVSGKYDLIVMGSEGHGLVSSVLLGSVSAKVLHHAQCSVLIVR